MWKLGVDIRGQGLYSQGCPRDGPVILTAPDLLGGSSNNRGRTWVQMCAFSARAETFKRVQLRIPSFPLVSAGASLGSNFGESWSFQKATEKEER